MRRFLMAIMSITALAVPAVSNSCLAADEPRPQFFDAKGVKIHFVAKGRGEPVVLIHGLHSSAEINWGIPGIIADLARDHRVIALDLPGHGRSARPEDETAYGLQVIEDVVLLLDHLKIAKAHVVGYSLGGMVALKLIAKHPDRALSGTIGGMGWLREGSRLQQLWGRMPAREGRRTPSAFVRSIGQFALTEDELKTITVPVKIIVGDRDPVERLYVAPLRQVQRTWPVVEIEDAGHVNCIMTPQFRREIVGWVREHTTR
jgi:pimeloyl-ACP methyl ester carboxylesterase